MVHDILRVLRLRAVRAHDVHATKVAAQLVLELRRDVAIQDATELADAPDYAGPPA